MTYYRWSDYVFGREPPGPNVTRNLQFLLHFIKPKMCLRRSLYHPEYREKLMEGMECHWHDEVVFTASARILLRAGLFKLKITQGKCEIWNQISKLKKQIQLNSFLSTIWWLSTLKRIEKLAKENTFDEKEKRRGEKFNPGLALIGLRTTGPSNNFLFFIHHKCSSIYNALRFPG